MKRVLIYIGVYILLTGLLFSCQTEKIRSEEGLPLPLRHASLLTITDTSDSLTIVTVKDAWHKGKDLARYVLVPYGKALPDSLPAGQIIRTPLRRIVLTSAVHASLLMELGAGDRVAGMTDTAFVVGKELKDYIVSRGIRDMGKLVPEPEKLRACGADAVWVSPFENSQNDLLSRQAVPLIECADYMENTPLARAEWMRFYGRLIGRAAQADSLFSAVEKAYLQIRQAASAKPGNRPTVFCDIKTSSIWYQPGGGSTTGQLIADAGGSYLWKDRGESGSIPLDMESVYSRAAQADIWLVKYGMPVTLTYQGLESDTPAYARFAAWKGRRIWACNTLQVPFYEECPFHPERVLTELARIFSHSPEAVHNRYYRPLR